MAHSPVPWATAVTQACAVLSTAHTSASATATVKPTHLMLCPDGSVKALDFGLALLRKSDSGQFTGIGQILDTSAYMSPEQIPHGQADARSDLYPLDCVLYEMLTGRPLFSGPTDYVVFEQQVKHPAPENPCLPPDLSRPLAQLLEKPRRTAHPTPTASTPASSPSSSTCRCCSAS